MGEWIETLRAECERTSQSRAAARLGVSPAMVNQALRGKYKGNLARLERLVRGELMKETVTCPVLGEIGAKRCLDEQARRFASTNPQRVQLYRACRNGCPHSDIPTGERKGCAP